jgi:hypothetical protein
VSQDAALFATERAVLVAAGEDLEKVASLMRLLFSSGATKPTNVFPSRDTVG